MKNLSLVYINNYAEECVKNHLMREYINNHLKTDEWTIFSNVIQDIPLNLAPHMTDDFFHGAAATQIGQMKNGGIFINSLLSAISIDYDLWSGIIAEHTDPLRTIIELDIPYAVYLECTTLKDRIDEDHYNENSLSIKTLVQALNEVRPEGETLH